MGGPSSTTANSCVAASDLEAFVAQLFEAVGVPPADAATVAAALVDADLGGVESHGVLRTGIYVERLRKGLVNARPELRAERSGARVLLDADNGLGQVAAVRAVEEACTVADELGVGVVAARHSNHFGTAAYYGRAMAARGCVAMVLTNAPPLIAPWGGADRVLGNNPICIAAPTAGPEPAVIDVSLTAVAGGKLLAAAARGESIPEGWAMDRAGRPMTDPGAAMKDGLLMPLGAHKGAGLALLVDILAGVLTGAGYGPGVRSIYGDSGKPNDAGHLMIALRADRFLPFAQYLERVEELLGVVRGVAALPGFDRIMIPGEPEAALRVRRRAEGIPLAEPVARDLRTLGDDLGVAFPTTNP
jgi:LDH2 family malate/lactate/ureidoglycolate dehydrogenase